MNFTERLLFTVVIFFAALTTFLAYHGIHAQVIAEKVIKEKDGTIESLRASLKTCTTPKSYPTEN